MRGFSVMIKLLLNESNFLMTVKNYPNNHVHSIKKKSRGGRGGQKFKNYQNTTKEQKTAINKIKKCSNCKKY